MTITHPKQAKIIQKTGVYTIILSDRRQVIDTATENPPDWKEQTLVYARGFYFPPTSL